ncbi:hemin transporter [Streptomyces eurocidicus]|uniref:nitric oxide dioxygenase n=1 Tax=Streptomyces eurocidicus TaxID=66423 RepID=A0A2N8NV09_STREU|nr:globin domain-containing protein [Streptomyces eurocidicus]MBB5122612.1 nitric oxide dioxygenase [Streptomyces eurocidicus]MBF6054692.1 hemin transporter [Streptomyces eurocidicus]PNE32572.1 hemin transporter [Streptomyces eurocidicus]
MLSPQSTEIVRATLPAVGGAIGEITPLFYDKLFADRPELLRDLFNRGNQANGSQRQALAGAIAAFATALVEHPDTRPDAMLARIAHKHASLGITPDQYPLVQQHLFAAIAEVLGEAITPEVAAAWDEVYWLMANALIALEARLYEEAGAPDGGTLRPCRITGRLRETADVATFLVQPLDGRPLPAGRPGQYVSVQVELPDGARQIRQYSLSGRPDDALQFSVKRLAGDPAGEVSNHLHDHLNVGDTLLVSAPFGDVALDGGDAPVLLASAGIGCTPMIGMLAHLAATGSTRRVVAVHADRSESAHAFRTDLTQLVAKLPDAAAHVWYERPEAADWPADRTGLADLTGVEIPAGTVAYLCGPLPFMRAVRAQLLTAGVPAADIHYEVFGPDLWLGTAS